MTSSTMKTAGESTAEGCHVRQVCTVPARRKEQCAGETACARTFVDQILAKCVEDLLQDKDALARLRALNALHEQGFINSEEMNRRKQDLLVVQPSECSCPTVIPASKRPNFSFLPQEQAIRHTFNYETMQWTYDQVSIRLDCFPFAKGSLRVVYHLQLESQPDEKYVAKLAIDPDEDPELYFRDVELQAHCAYYARRYNEYDPPKRVDFVHGWVFEIPSRGGALCAVERFIDGEYRKHNNNYGSVSEDERNTPQAFSHFTFEASDHKLLAIDIQGVGDVYTDPQIHTLSGDGFGKGNLGVRGFQKFMASHRCNPICRYLKLPSVNPRYDAGTVPLEKVMMIDSIRPVEFESKHYYEQSPSLQKFITQCRREEQSTQRWCTGCVIS